MKGIFVTGTDTGVGKTVVTAGLTRILRAAGLDAAPMKPVQTGCVSTGESLSAPDLEFALCAAGLAPDPSEKHLMCPYCYEPACSPHLAGRLAGHDPQVDKIVEAARRLGRRRQVVIAEGAGGVLVPLNERETMLDLMRQLHWPVVLVARGALGTINHTLLSLRALRGADVDVLGVVFNDDTLVARDVVRQDNPLAVATFGRVDVLGGIPYLGELGADEVADATWRTFDKNLPGFPRILDALT